MSKIKFGAQYFIFGMRWYTKKQVHQRIIVLHNELALRSQKRQYARCTLKK